MFESIGNWAVKKTIKIQLRRLNLASLSEKQGLKETSQHIVTDVLSELADWFIKEHDLLKEVIDEYFSEAGCSDQVYQAIMEAAIAKHGGPFAMRAAGFYG